MWGIRVFCRFCSEECGALVGDSFQSKMAAIILARTSGYISAHCVVFVIQINTSINLGMDLRRQTL